MVDKNDFIVLNGNSLEVLKTLEEKSIDCCVTSPPYYGLRDYGTGHWVGGDPNCNHVRDNKVSKDTCTGHKSMAEKGEFVGDAIYKSVCPKCGAVRVDEQIGLEESPEQYIENLIKVFREVKRVLKDDGTLWVNIGDSYNGSGGNHNASHKNDSGFQGVLGINYGGKGNHVSGVKPKDLIGIPWMLAFALRNDGWYLRQDIIWCLSGGTHLYVKTDKVVAPMMIKDIIRLDPKKVKLWNGEKWVNIVSWRESNDFSNKIELVLRSGERISCTDGHRWVLKDGTEKLASQLQVGDVLMTTQLPDDGSHNPSMLTDDVLWLIGLFIAEGSFSDDCIQLSLNSDEIGWIERIRRAVESVGGTVTHSVNGNMLSVRIYSKVFLAILSQYVGGRNAKTKHLNNICWKLPNKSLMHIAKGYLDGDGSYDSENNRIRLGFTRNYNLERDLRLLANRLGASITLNLSNSHIGDKKYPSFSGEWRWEVSNHFNNKDRSEIVKIRRGRARHYYDIEVDCDSHLFALSSGVITHNCKPNPMPESVTDRFTKSHEYIFLLSKSPQYYFDHENAMEIATGYDGRQDTFLKGSPKYAGQDYGQTEQSFASQGHERWKFRKVEVTEKSKYADGDAYGSLYAPNSIKQKGNTYVQSLRDGIPMRNKRDVWDIGVGNYKGAHFATYPIELVENCLLCGCPVGGTVLDPFSGSGTTGICAVANGRKYIGIELNKKYVELSNQRFDETFYRKVCPKTQSDCTDFKKFDFGEQLND